MEPPRDDWQDCERLCEAPAVRDARLHAARYAAATLLLEQGVVRGFLLQPNCRSK
jgi:hypothetical protein